MRKRMTDSEIDFVPEDNEWIPETSPEFWESEEDEDMEETMVLEVVEPYEESREPYSKYGKDPYANLGQEPEAWPEKTVPRGQKAKTQKMTGTAGRTLRGKKAGSRFWQGKKGKSRGKTRKSPAILRIASLVLMGILLAGLFRGFWTSRAVLGSVLRVVEEKNYAELVYLLLALSTMAYGAFSLLWLLSKRRVYYEGKLLRVDAGRGLTSFFVFALLAFVSARAALRLPGDSWIFHGLSQYFLVVASVQNLVYICSGLGVLCCILRKISDI
ncbi:MAG: hypothetical protein HFI68_03300 [Lachnospiraceae bacterium]|nr:hypothetical protein [Lachnospiraceae bacterium]